MLPNLGLDDESLKILLRNSLSLPVSELRVVWGLANAVAGQHVTPYTFETLNGTICWERI